MTFRQTCLLLFLASAALLITLSGCEDSVSPFVGEDRPFTIWGYMDAGADTQSVRVFSIDERPGTDRSGPIDATVISTNLNTGEQKMWTDSVVTYYDGSAGHVFWSPFRANYEHRYRLEVIRSDGAISSAEVTLPSPSAIHLDAMSPMSFIPVSISGTVPNVVDLRVIYEAAPAYPANPWPTGENPPVILPVSVSYDSKKRAVANGWAFEIEMQKDMAEIKHIYGGYCLPDSAMLRRMEVRFLAADSAWLPPGGTFDVDDLIEPNAFSNIENGYGFFGAGQTVSLRWIPPREAQRSAGFVITPPCPITPAPHCTINWPCFRCEDPLTPALRRFYCSNP